MSGVRRHRVGVGDRILVSGTPKILAEAGYAGRSPDRRGRHAGDQPLWSMSELQELLDECWSRSG